VALVAALIYAKSMLSQALVAALISVSSSVMRLVEMHLLAKALVN
jgi:hypothetical protein